MSAVDAVNALTGRYPAFRAKVTAAPGASVDAAVASATRTVLPGALGACPTPVPVGVRASKPMGQGDGAVALTGWSPIRRHLALRDRM
jgi:hypothetical protein